MPSSTSSSRTSRAALLAALVIVLIEGWVAIRLPPNQGRHRVDEILATLDRPQARRPLVVLGDSVSHGGLHAVDVPDSILVLASNGSIGFAGMAFTYERLIERTPPPDVLVLALIPESFGVELRPPSADSYFETTFLRWREIEDFGVTSRRWQQVGRMVMNKLLLPPSFKSRAEIRRALGLLPDDLTLDTGVQVVDHDQVPPAVATALAERRRLRVFRFPAVQRAYLDRLARDTARSGTRLVITTGALPTSVVDAWRATGFLAQYQRALASFAAAHPNVVVEPVDAFARFADVEMFDRTHLARTARGIYGRALVDACLGLLGRRGASESRSPAAHRSTFDRPPV